MTSWWWSYIQFDLRTKKSLPQWAIVVGGLPRVYRLYMFQKSYQGTDHKGNNYHLRLGYG